MPEGYCYVCFSRKFIQREDDNEETAGKRLEFYQRLIPAVLSYYERKNLLRGVYGTASIESVTGQIERMII